MSFDALARDGQGTENLRLLCRFGNGQEGVMGRQKIVLGNYSTHKNPSIFTIRAKRSNWCAVGWLVCLLKPNKISRERREGDE